MAGVKGRVLRKGPCGKGVYNDEEAALHGIAQRNRELKAQGEPAVQLRPYLCRRCRKHHLTKRGAAEYWEARNT